MYLVMKIDFIFIKSAQLKSETVR